MIDVASSAAAKSGRSLGDAQRGHGALEGCLGAPNVGKTRVERYMAPAARRCFPVSEMVANESQQFARVLVERRVSENCWATTLMHRCACPARALELQTVTAIVQTGGRPHHLSVPRYYLMKKRSHLSSVGRLLAKLQELDPSPVDSQTANGLRQRRMVAVARSTWTASVPYALAST